MSTELRIDADSLRARRHDMVDREIAQRGIHSPAILNAMRAVPRELFLPAELRECAYDDTPLPIEQGQTISQPYIVALMAEALLLTGVDTILEIGTGSGYAAAVLSHLAAKIYSVERHEQLASKAADVLGRNGYRNVQVLHADGTLGWPEHAPYDAIVVAAGGPQVPESLKSQLRMGGRLVIPVGGERGLQELLRITRTTRTAFSTEELMGVRFVPLIGEQGWSPAR